MSTALPLHVKIEVFLPRRASSQQYRSLFTAFAGAYARRAEDPASGLPQDPQLIVSDAIEGWTQGRFAPPAGDPRDYGPALTRFLRDWAAALTAPRDGRSSAYDSPAEIAAQLKTVADMPGAQLRLRLAALGGRVDGEVVLHLTHAEAIEICAAAKGRARRLP